MYIINVFLFVALFLGCVKKTLFSFFYEYGEYQISNLLTSVMNVSVSENIDGFVLDNVIFQTGDSGETHVDFNLEAINSMACNIVNMAQKILRSFEYGGIDNKVLEQINFNDSLYELKDGIIYKIPISMVFDNFLVSNLGFEIPVKYKFLGSIMGNVVSSVDEYGLNNALIKINLNIVVNAKVILPISTYNRTINIEIPMIIKAINGKVPSYYLGTNIIGEVN